MPLVLLSLTISHASLATQPSIADTPCIQQPDSKQLCLIELPEDAIHKLKIDAGFGWGIFSGTIYNGNNNYHVTQLVISMTPIHDHHHMSMHANMPSTPKIHRIDLELPPTSKSALSMPLAGDDVHIHDFEWKIIKVIGYQIH